MPWSSALQAPGQEQKAQPEQPHLKRQSQPSVASTRLLLTVPPSARRRWGNRGSEVHPPPGAPAAHAEAGRVSKHTAPKSGCRTAGRARARSPRGSSPGTEVLHSVPSPCPSHLAFLVLLPFPQLPLPRDLGRALDGAAHLLGSAPPRHPSGVPSAAWGQCGGTDRHQWHPWPLEHPVSCLVHPFSSWLSPASPSSCPCAVPVHSSLWSLSLSPIPSFCHPLFPSPPLDMSWIAPRAVPPSLAPGPVGSRHPSCHALTFWVPWGLIPLSARGPAPFFLSPQELLGASHPLGSYLEPGAHLPLGHLCGPTPGHQPELSCSACAEVFLGSAPLRPFLGFHGVPP